MPMHPTVYAELLAEKIRKHGAKVWLVNTGWTGGPYGIGSRMKLAYTRAMLSAAIAGDLDGVEFEEEPFFRLSIPVDVPGVPTKVLNPRNTWEDVEAYDQKAKELAKMFKQNFEKYQEQASQATVNAGPNI